jgi:uncharacterized protein YdaU (DUF1376 family)
MTMQEITPKAGKNKTGKRPYMRLFTSDYRDGTVNLDFELQGFYFRILTYLHDGETVPADASELARFLQCNARTVRKLLPKLIALGKLYQSGFELKNPRIERELEANSTPIQPEFEPNSAPKIQKHEPNQEGSDHYYRADHFHSQFHSQKEEIATIQPEPDGRQNLKSAFNGSTDAMLADVLTWMGPLARMDNATKWLTGTLSAYGSERTTQAWTMIAAKQGRGEPVGNPLALWSKTAGGIKLNSAQPQQSAKVAGATRAREALDRMMEAAS